MIKIGITGSLASGKTTASKILSNSRGPLFSADKIAKKLYEKKSFRSIISKKFGIKNNNLIIPFIFLFIAEIFPFKSTGSFFTTGNATYIFLILGIIIGLVRRDNSIAK